MFCSSAVLDPRAGHTMNVLSPFISVLCHSDWLFHGEFCPRLDVVHPRCAYGLPRLRAPGIVPCIISFSTQLHCFLTVWSLYDSFFALTVFNSSFLTPALLRTPTHLFSLLSTKLTSDFFISVALRRLYSFFLSVQLSQLYVATGHTSAFISRILIEIGMLWLIHIFALIPRSPLSKLYGIPSYTRHLLCSGSQGTALFAAGSVLMIHQLCRSASEVANRMMSSAQRRFVIIAL